MQVGSGSRKAIPCRSKESEDYRMSCVRLFEGVLQVSKSMSSVLAWGVAKVLLALEVQPFARSQGPISGIRVVECKTLETLQ